jgi:hypothetical protein
MIKSSSGTTYVGNQTISQNISQQKRKIRCFEREKPAEFAIGYLETIIIINS